MGLLQSSTGENGGGSFTGNLLWCLPEFSTNNHNVLLTGHDGELFVGLICLYSPTSITSSTEQVSKNLH